MTEYYSDNSLTKHNNMSVFELAMTRDTRDAFLRYHAKRATMSRNSADYENMCSYISSEACIEDLKKLIRREYTITPPLHRCINKNFSSRKRDIYFWRGPVNYLLKLLVFVLHKYDYIFSDGLYSFRTSLSAKDFLLKLRQHKDFGAYYILKTDISNYVSSIVPELIIPQLSEIFGDDPALFDFLKNILLRKECIEPDGQIVSCEPGCLGGIPIANMFMNIYLMEVDSYFYPNAPLYARYSDDIIIFAESLDKAEEYRNHLLGILMKKRLHINESKTYLVAPGEEVDILGCRVKGGMLDISNLSKNKIKRRIRIHANYLLKLKKEGGLTAEETGKRMTAYCNGIFFGHAGTNKLTWSRWLFPVITETSSLKELDHYIQEAVRYVMCGSFSNKKYSITYRQLQDLGYKNLLHSYYHFKYRLK